MRRAAKVDSSQPDLVKDLRKAGIDVWVIKQPVDLLLRFWCNRHRDYCWQPLELKTPNRKDGTARPRTDQGEQTRFLLETNTPVATDFQSAVAALNQRHALGIRL